MVTKPSFKFLVITIDLFYSVNCANCYKLVTFEYNKVELEFDSADQSCMLSISATFAMEKFIIRKLEFGKSINNYVKSDFASNKTDP